MSGPVYRESISPYYRNLVQSAQGPLGRQVMYDPQEAEPSGFEPDGLDELNQSPLPHLIHRYPHQALILSTNVCATLCRFCFRKRLWAEPPFFISDSEITAVIAYLHQHPEIYDVLISGGDPFMLEPKHLLTLLDKLSAVPSIKVMRIGTRVPVTDPDRITGLFAHDLGRFHNLSILTHFNHPRELTAKALRAIARFQSQGVTVFNQTVLLKGVNDDPEILIDLFTDLAAARIHPHYLFHVDPVEGVAHFATGLRRAHAIYSLIRKRLSSLALPQLAIDLPHGRGKILISPDLPLPEDLVFTSPLTGEAVKYPFA